jgi:hypothetical protein
LHTTIQTTQRLSILPKRRLRKNKNNNNKGKEFFYDYLLIFKKKKKKKELLLSLLLKYKYNFIIIIKNSLTVFNVNNIGKERVSESWVNYNINHTHSGLSSLLLVDLIVAIIYTR